MSTIQDTNCPTCKKVQELLTMQHNHTHNEEKPHNHEELAKLMPKSANFAKCRDGNCEKGLIKNANPTRKFKSCPNCKNNAVPKSGDYCPTCGLTNEDLEKNETEWDNSDLEIPEDDE